MIRHHFQKIQKGSTFDRWFIWKPFHRRFPCKDRGQTM